MMGEAYFAMCDLGKTIDELCCVPFNMSLAHHVELLGSFYRGWCLTPKANFYSINKRRVVYDLLLNVKH